MIDLGIAAHLRDDPAERAAAAARAEQRSQFAYGTQMPPEWFQSVSASTAGVSVTYDSARTIAAYTNGLTVISGDIGLLDRHLFKRVNEEDDRERAVGHPVYKVVHDAPNDYTTSVVFWQTIAAHALGWGNGYAEIEWTVGFQPRGMHILTPDRVQVIADTVKDERGIRRTRVRYLVDGSQWMKPEDIFHLPGLGFDGTKGYSVVQMARQSLGLSIAMEKFGSAYFANGAWPGLALQHPKTLSPDAAKRLAASIDNRHGGPGQAHRTIVLEEGMTVSKPITIPPEDGQWLESRAFGIEEVARWLNLPPHKLKHQMGNRPGGNLEESEIEYTTGTLLPWTTKIDQELNRKLVVRQPEYYVETQFGKLLRTNASTRSEIQKTYHDMGVLSAEQIARQENLPRPKPMAPVTAPAPAAVAPPAPPPAPSANDSAVRAATRALVLERVSSYVAREASRMRDAATKGPAALEEWGSGYYDRGEALLADVLMPLVRLRLTLVNDWRDVGATAHELAVRHVATSREQLLGLRAKNLALEADRLAKRWEQLRAVELTDAVMALGAEEGEANAA